jgi:hypothetical protein
MKQYPIFINCRDRLTYLRDLTSWLEKAGQERIYLVDNDSTYEPLLEWYESVAYEVVFLRTNGGQHAPWTHGVTDRYASGEFFVVTDPDVVPVEECPHDAIEYFESILTRYTDRSKCGFNLKIDDLPDCFKFKAEVIQHESQYQFWTGPEQGLHFAPIDTTFALYRPGGQPDISHSCRTDYPYEARHMSWYVDSLSPGYEEEF